jgi:hypothetical protein
MEAIYSSKISVDTQRTTRRYIPEHGTLHNHRCENLKFYNICNLWKWKQCVCLWMYSKMFLHIWAVESDALLVKSVRSVTYKLALRYLCIGNWLFATHILKRVYTLRTNTKVSFAVRWPVYTARIVRMRPCSVLWLTFLLYRLQCFFFFARLKDEPNIYISAVSCM